MGRGASDDGRSSYIIRSPQDVLACINAMETTPRRGLLISILALGTMFVDIYELNAFSIGSLQIAEEFNLSGVSLALITAATPAGAVIGALIGGRATDRVGRLPMLVLDLILFVVCTLGTVLAANTVLMGVFRLGIGLGIGLDVPVAMSLIVEATALRQRGRVANSMNIPGMGSGVVVFLLAAGLTKVVDTADLWRWVVGMGAVFALIILVLRYLFMAESPAWLAQRGRLDEAAEVLQQKYGVICEVDSSLALTNQEESWLAPYKEIFKPAWRGRAATALILPFAQAAEYFAIGYYLPTILSDLVGEGIYETLLGSLALVSVGLLGAILCPIVTGRFGFGYRRIGLTGFGLAGIGLVAAGTLGRHSPVLGAIALGIFIFGHCFGATPVGYVMASVSFPVRVRGTAAGLAQASVRIGSLVGAFLFPILAGAIGIFHAVLATAIASLLGVLTLTVSKWDPIRADIDAEDIAPPLPSPGVPDVPNIVTANGTKAITD